MMNEKEKTIIEKTTRKCISRLKDVKVTEQQIQSMLSRLYYMKDLKTVMDSLALNVSGFFGRPEQIQDFNQCIKDIMQIDDTVYDSPEALLSQLQKNKETNYTPGNIPIEENHKLISDTLKSVCDKLNDLDVDYYVVGALSTFIETQTPLFRYHGDIDFMIAEKDIPKVQEALKDSEYNFSDDRLNNKKRLTPGVGHTQGEHEVIANHKENEFHLGFFLFRREQDNSITVREYFMEENEEGEKVAKILERHEPAELVALEYSEKLTDFAGTQFRTSTPESVYAKKMLTKHPKDMLDLQALRDKVDFNKIREMEQYHSIIKVVEPYTEQDREYVKRFQREKENLIKNRESAIQRIKKEQEKYDKIKSDDNIDKKELRLEIAQKTIQVRQHALGEINDKLEFLRPANQEDIDYRLKKYSEFSKQVKAEVPDDLHLCFHGCPIYAARHIIEDGEISSSVDRIGSETSYDVSDQVSVTTKNTIETTVQGYTGLTGNYNLPAGCIFAIVPKDENEIQTSETSMLIGNVSFKENPERLYAIITTPENIERVTEWAEKGNIDLSKVYDFEGFIQDIEKQKTQFSEQEIGRATINISTEDKDRAQNYSNRQNERQTDGINIE